MILSTAFVAIASTSSYVDGSPSPITLTNRISIVNDTTKIEREKTLLVDFIKKVHQNEPGVLDFKLSLDMTNATFLTYETYASQDAISIHLNSTYMKDLLTTEQNEGLKRANNEVYFLDLVTQFIRS